MLAAVFTGVVTVLLRHRVDAGRDMPAYSVYSEEADGLAPLARWLRQIHFTPLALTRPVQQFWKPTDQPALLVMVEPTPETPLPGLTTDLPEADVKAIVRWIEDGNTLFLVGRRSHGLHTALGVTLNANLKPDIVETVHEAAVAEAGAYTRHVDALTLEGGDSLQAADGLPLCWVDGRPAALLLRRGKGRAIVVADPSLLTLRGLDRKNRPGNGDFLYNVFAIHAGDGRIYFDEYHHGLHSGGGFWGYLAFHGLRWILFPILITAGIAAWAVAVRLGPAVPLVQAKQADAVDYASALARIYQRAGVRGLLARNAARDFLTAVGKSLGLRRATVPAEVLVAWRRRNPNAADAARLEELLRGVGTLRQDDVSERFLLAWARGADQFLRDTSAAPGSGRRL